MKLKDIVDDHNSYREKQKCDNKDCGHKIVNETSNPNIYINKDE
jgi:hypothetical protein